jgi:hypothetical protein
MLFAILILSAFVSSFLASYSCVVRKVYLEQNELGVVDLYGFIKHGAPEEGLSAKIADKDVAVVSQGFLYEFYQRGEKIKKYKDKYGEID